jgi:hypothetical protein
LVTGALPSDVAPLKNSTVPVAAAGVTVAVNVTGWPTVEVAGFTASVVVEFAFDTVWEIAVEVLAA